MTDVYLGQDVIIIFSAVCPRCRERGFVYGPLCRHALGRWSQARTPTLSNPPSLQLFQHPPAFLLPTKQQNVQDLLLTPPHSV